jgi:kynurenine 3-monooxygenase
MKGEIAIVGAGLSGALAARLLGGAGWRVRVFEKRSDPRAAAGVGAGAPRAAGLGTGVSADGRSSAGRRSIGLGISESARALLAQAGLGDVFSRISVPMTGRVVHSSDGATTFQPYGPRRPGRRADAILVPEGLVYSVRREDLAAALVTLADRLPDVSFHFQRTVTDVDPYRASIDVVGSADGSDTGADGVGESAFSAQAVIGADGAFSRVRRSFRSVAGFEEERTETALEYKQLTIPAETSTLRRDAHHVWPRHGIVLTALPCHDGSFTAALFLPRPGRWSFDSIGTQEEFVSFFETEFPDVAPLFPDLGREYADSPASTLFTLRCRPWHRGRAVLAGDACHAFVPFSGQGANAALEDAVALTSSIADHAPDWEKAFERYAERRMPDTDAIAELSQVMTPLVLWLAGPLMAGPEAASP